jgi:hypothetical protein
MFDKFEHLHLDGFLVIVFWMLKLKGDLGGRQQCLVQWKFCRICIANIGLFLYDFILSPPNCIVDTVHFAFMGSWKMHSADPSALLFMLMPTQRPVWTLFDWTRELCWWESSAQLHVYVKFDALFKYLMNHSTLMLCLFHFPSLCHLCYRRPPRFVPLYQILMHYIHL